MVATIHPSGIRGTIQAPPSKSIMQRACLAAMIRRGQTVLHHPGHAADDLALAHFLVMGKCKLQWDQDQDSLYIDSHGANLQTTHEVAIGESGLAARMLIPVLALESHPIVLSGIGSLMKRPMHFFDEVLPALQVEIISRDGMLPITIKGPLQPANITIDGSVSSQFLTGLIMAYSAVGANDVAIKVQNLTSKPYIDMTLEVLQALDLEIPDNAGYEVFTFRKKTGPVKRGKFLDFTIEGDWSGAAFMLVAGAIAGETSVKGLNALSSQGDKAILGVLSDAGAIVSAGNSELRVQHAPLKAFHFNASDCPDLFPPLAVLAAYSEGTSVIEGTSRLAYKESDRAITLQQELGKMGADISLKDDRMIVAGGLPLHGAAVSSRDDHRIAMACAIAGFKADGPTTITGAEAVDKSYPDFFADLQSLGCQLSITP